MRSIAAARHATALLLLDRGMSCDGVASVLFLGDDTVRSWHGSFKTGGVDSVHGFVFKGGSSYFTAKQIEQLRAWATKTLPGTTREIGISSARTSVMTTPAPQSSSS
ncbi:transposase [Rhodoblastus sphagnicola]|uniref:helix-turn-helix domain-containing protein n=1 Tax=Rhodoblastus sphagnicola TaxID=333368 RepID=UPI0011B08BD6|nr:helix-turn-helix domain-containing protein [Rhodoblastus sphagnicola]MBB4200191.1 transposase [Rhodoblastus sphagnicola]